MVLVNGVKEKPDIWRGFKLFGYLLVSFTSSFGGVWVDMVNGIVIPRFLIYES